MVSRVVLAPLVVYQCVVFLVIFFQLAPTAQRLFALVCLSVLILLLVNLLSSLLVVPLNHIYSMDANYIYNTISKYAIIFYTIFYYTICFQKQARLVYYINLLAKQSSIIFG